ncbi:MAG: hypothetical protein V2J42_13640 [Wenzhouxiangella sp.]|jgi:hypothetical protein|nr:hypothetical protein [Wenzhouxiangella sp.]
MEIIATMLAVMAFAFAADANSKVSKLEKRLRAKGLIDDGPAPDDESN